MTMTLQEISDRFEIQDLVMAYSDAIDRGEFDRLEAIFTEDAYIDYTELGGEKGDRASIKQFLQKALPAFSNTHHLLANHRIQLDGDRATGTIVCFNPMQLDLPEQQNPVFFIGLWYHDVYRRTADGWRIERRVEERCYDFNTPDFINTSAS